MNKDKFYIIDNNEEYCTLKEAIRLANIYNQDKILQKNNAWCWERHDKNSERWSIKKDKFFNCKIKSYEDYDSANERRLDTAQRVADMQLTYSVFNNEKCY